MNKEGDVFHYLRQMFPRKTDAKIKENIFFGPQIRYVFTDKYFEDLLMGSKRIGWKAFKDVVERIFFSQLKNFLQHTKP